MVSTREPATRREPGDCASGPDDDTLLAVTGGQALLQRQAASQRAFFRALGAASEGASVLDLCGGVQATAAPVRPWYSIFNSVVFEEPHALAEQLPRLGDFYRDAGSKAWAVWVPPACSTIDERLTAAGLRVDSNPLLMAADIDELDLAPRLELALMSGATAEAVAAVNDRAHGVLAEWSMTAVFERLDPDVVRPYVALADGEPASALLAVEHMADCYFWFVATAPEAQGRGLASALVRHALREARARGCTTTTLESTKVAETLYGRLGFRSFGRYRMWEWRDA